MSIFIQRSDGQMMDVLEPGDVCSLELPGSHCEPEHHHPRCPYYRMQHDRFAAILWTPDRDGNADPHEVRL